VTSLVPGLTQFLNGEYLKGTIFLLGTAGAYTMAAVSSVNGWTEYTELQENEIDPDNPKEVKVNNLFLGLILLGGSSYIWSYIDGVMTSFTFRNQKSLVETGMTYKVFQIKRKEEEERKRNELRAETLRKATFTDREIEAIIARRIFIGMSEDALIESWGKPNDINRTVNAYTVHKQYVYGVSPHKKYVYVDDGVVTAWQD
jgi:hypothetical protein